MAEHNRVGQIGEDIALSHYIKKGYRLIARNFRKSYGEIDLIMKKGGVVVFIEVKTLSVKDEKYLSHNVSAYLPEEAVHHFKQHKFKRIIEAYLATHEVGKWSIDIASVKVHLPTRKARIKVIADVILE